MDHTKHIINWLSSLILVHSGKSSQINSAQRPPSSPSLSNESSMDSAMTAASATHNNYRAFLGFRNIHIQKVDPPAELMQRAQEIISRPRKSREMNEKTFKKLMKTRDDLQDENETVLINRMAPSIIPGYNQAVDSRLAFKFNQLWFDSVPVPLASQRLSVPLPLSRPRPDLAIGNSANAFNMDQLDAVGLLVHDEFGTSYAVPDQSLYFPFLIVGIQITCEKRKSLCRNKSSR